ncbi:MAG: PP2C family protein-serine/threonine phosphatase [bacterium]|jgi:serine/threonine protein phosphatase PrpC
MKFVFAAQTDIGKRRSINEDAFLLCREKGLIAVADGIGGFEAGEVASRLAIEILDREIQKSSDSPAQSLTNAVLCANRVILEYAWSCGLSGRMGTTLVAAIFHGEDVTFTSIGDSRIYCLRDGQIRQNSRDHTLMNDHLDLGLITAEDIPTYPYRHVITKSLGIDQNLSVSVQQEKIRNSDVWLMCTDGLTDMLNNGEISATLDKYRENPEEGCKSLIQFANEKGGKDNITAAIALVLNENHVIY